MIVLNMCDRVLEVMLIGGDHHGETALIPRITLSPSSSTADFTFRLKHCQFPVRLAFVMSINRSQGQTVKHVGIDLTNPVFTHGQLYVAFSRATSPVNVKVLLPHDVSSAIAENIVYPEVLLR
jgi:hypothetical protein